MSGARFVSYHVYFTGQLYSQADDTVLIDVVRPVCQKLHSEIVQYFFVRYADPLPHVRLRLRPLRDGSIASLRSASRSTIDGVLGRNEDSPLGVRAVEIDYVPETERYGSGTALEVAHTVFFESSKCAMSLLRRGTGQSGGIRLGVATALIATTLAVFIDSPSRLCNFIESYASGCEARWNARTKAVPDAVNTSPPTAPIALASEVLSLMARARHDGRLPSPLQRYANAMKRARAKLSSTANGLPPRCGDSVDGVITHILPSYVHMTCNRIGLDPRAEGVAARILTTIIANGYACDRRA